MSKKFLSEVGIANVIAEPKQSKFSIYEIIGSRRLDLVRALIGRGLFVPDPEDIGNFPVHTAIAAGDNFILQALINAVRDELKLYKNFRGENALHFAARIGSSSAVSILLDSEFDINEKMDDGRTAMMLACSSGSFGTVKALARRGHVDYSMQDLHGKTCWHYAIEDFILRKNCSKYMRSDGYGNKSVAYLINPEILEILKFLSSYAKYALGIKGAEVDFPSDIPLDILYIGEVHRVFRGMEKNYGVSILIEKLRAIVLLKRLWLFLVRNYSPLLIEKL